MSNSNCFPKDVTALKQLAGNSGYHFQLLNAVIEVNELQKRRVMAKLEKHLGTLVGKTVALLGLAFKPNTDDMREATSLVLSARLQAAGAKVRAYDPVAEHEARKLMPGLEFADDALSAVAGADAAVLVTEWDEFKELDFEAVAEAMRGTLIIDGRNALDPDAVPPPGSPTRASGDREERGNDAGGDPRRRRGDAPAAVDLDRAQAGRPARRPPVHRLHARVAGRHGVDDVVMSCGFLATAVRNVLGDGARYGLRLRFMEEPEPRGTAGALKYAEDFLDERFLMLNGDVLTDIDLTAQIAQHDATGAVGTLALVSVADPTAYGLVRLNDDQSVKEFVEKPSADQIDTKLISAGAYVLERSVLDLIEPGATSRSSARCGPSWWATACSAIAAEAYWLDIGTPERYLQGTFDILEGNVATAVADRLGPATWRSPTACSPTGASSAGARRSAAVEIAAGAHVGSLVVLGEGVSVGEGTTIERSVVMNGAEIGPGCVLRDCIVAAGVRIGEGSDDLRRRRARRGRDSGGAQRPHARRASLSADGPARRRHHVLRKEGRSCPAPSSSSLTARRSAGSIRPIS